MYLSAPIPVIRLSHCPYIRISNMKACPRQVIYTHYHLTHFPLLVYIR